MAEFGMGMTFDMIIWLSPFAVFAILRILAAKLTGEQIACFGFICVGIMCLCTRAVRLPHHQHLTGLGAVTWGLLLIVGPALTLWAIRKKAQSGFPN